MWGRCRKAHQLTSLTSAGGARSGVRVGSHPRRRWCRVKQLASSTCCLEQLQRESSFIHCYHHCCRRRPSSASFALLSRASLDRFDDTMPRGLSPARVVTTARGNFARMAISRVMHQASPKHFRDPRDARPCVLGCALLGLDPAPPEQGSSSAWCRTWWP